jgi:carbamoyl-phosphate synthase large subunit
LRNEDKRAAVELAQGLLSLGFDLVATHGTATCLRDAGLSVRGINKVMQGRPHCVDAMENGEIAMVFNTTEDGQAILDSLSLRRAALICGISYFTTVRAARAAVAAIQLMKAEGLTVKSLQQYH